MPFQREIDSIVRDLPGAVGAILVDFEGEAIVASPVAIPHYDLKVVGAYGGIFLEQLRRVTRDSNLGTPLAITIDGADSRLLISALKDGYHLLLVLSKDSILPLARERMRIAAERLLAEL